MAEIVAHRANPGADIDAIITVLAQYNTFLVELRADYNALLAKLDADAGVTDTTYVSLRAIAAPVPDTLNIGY
jgi:hypothetical protein